MAKGLGRKLVCAHAVKERLLQKPGRVLVVCRQHYDLAGWKKAFKTVLGDGPTYTDDATLPFADADVVFASGNVRGMFFGRFAHVIIDEATTKHGASWDFFDNTDVSVIGTCITVRSAYRDTIKAFYGKPVFSLPLAEAMAHGYTRKILVYIDAETEQSWTSLTTERIFRPQCYEKIQTFLHTFPDLNRVLICKSRQSASSFAANLPDVQALHEQGERLSDAMQAGNALVLVDPTTYSSRIVINVACLVAGFEARYDNFEAWLGVLAAAHHIKTDLMLFIYVPDLATLSIAQNFFDWVKRACTQQKQPAKKVYELTVSEIVTDIRDWQAESRRLPKAYLVNKLLSKVQQLGRRPTYAEMHADPDMPSPDTYMRQFKIRSWPKVAELIITKHSME